MKDPAAKTKFYNEIAKKLCSFSEEVERENYIEAVAEKYHIGFENLRKLVIMYAAKSGLVSPAVRPKTGIQSKNTPEEAIKKAQKLLLTWITDEPEVYEKIKKYITPKDFTVTLYETVAEKLFAGIEKNEMNPAAIISLFSDEEEQREIASLFNTKLEQLETKQERERAFHDILLRVKKNSYEYQCSRMGFDVTALTSVIEGKKALEELGNVYISL